MILVVGLAVCGCGSGEFSAEEVRALLDSGSYDRAIEVLDQAIAGDPGLTDAHLLMGRACVGLGMIDRASRSFARVEELEGGAARARIDDVIYREYTTTFRRVFPARSARAIHNLNAVTGGLGLVASRSLQRDAVQWTFEQLLAHQRQDASDYEHFLEAFVDRAEMDEHEVQEFFAAAVEQLAVRAGESEDVEVTALRLVRRVESNSRRRQLDALLDSYKPDVYRAWETMADMRLLAATIERFGMDTAAYPVADTWEDMRPLLEPTYIRDAPTVDGWGTAFEFRSRSRKYVIISAGSDRMLDAYYEGTDLDHTGAVRGFERDIVLIDGAFAQYPDTVDQ